MGRERGGGAGTGRKAQEKGVGYLPTQYDCVLAPLCQVVRPSTGMRDLAPLCSIE